MIVIGDETTLIKDCTWKSWLEFIKSKSLVYQPEKIEPATGKGRGKMATNSSGSRNKSEDNRGGSFRGNRRGDYRPKR